MKKKLSKRRRATQQAWQHALSRRQTPLQFEVDQLFSRAIHQVNQFNRNRRQQKLPNEALLEQPYGVRYRVTDEIATFLATIITDKATPGFVLSLLNDRQRRFLAVKPGHWESFDKPHDWGSFKDDLAFNDYYPAGHPLTLEVCKWLWQRGNVYRHYATDLADIMDRWAFPGYKGEFAARFYDSWGRLIQPKMPVRPCTIAKLRQQRKRLGSAKPITGRFLDP